MALLRRTQPTAAPQPATSWREVVSLVSDWAYCGSAVAVISTAAALRLSSSVAAAAAAALAPLLVEEWLAANSLASFAFSQLLVAVAAARSWGSLSWDDRRLVAAWAATTLVLPAWRRFAPARSPRTRATLEAALQLCNTASPTALSLSLVSASTMARLQRLQNAALFLAGAATSKGGLWGALHVRTLAGCCCVVLGMLAEH